MLHKCSLLLLSNSGSSLLCWLVGWRSFGSVFRKLAQTTCCILLNGRPTLDNRLKVFNGTQRFIGFPFCRSSRSLVDRIFQVSKSFNEINEAEIDEKSLRALASIASFVIY